MRKHSPRSGHKRSPARRSARAAPSKRGKRGHSGLRGGVICDPEIRKYATVLLVAAALFTYYRNEGMQSVASQVFAWAQQSLAVSGDFFSRAWTFATSTFNSGYGTFGDGLRAANSVALLTFTGGATLIAAYQVLRALWWLDYLVFGVCAFMTQSLRIGRLIYANPAAAAAVAAVLGTAVYAGAAQLGLAGGEAEDVQDFGGGLVLYGGAWCDPDIKNYVLIIVLAACLYVYFRQENMMPLAIEVFGWTKRVLTVAGDFFLKIWDFATAAAIGQYALLRILISDALSSQAAATLQMAAQNFQGQMTLLVLLRSLLRNAWCLDFLVTLVCAFVSSELRITKLVYASPEAATAVVSALATAYTAQAGLQGGKE